MKIDKGVTTLETSDFMDTSCVLCGQTNPKKLTRYEGIGVVCFKHIPECKYSSS